MSEHIHAEVIRAIAEGRPVQCGSIFGWLTQTPEDLLTNNPITNPHVRWRVMPESKTDAEHKAKESLPQTRQMIIENRAYTITFTENGGYEYRPGEWLVLPKQTPATPYAPKYNSLEHTFPLDGSNWTKPLTIDCTKPGNTLGPIEAAIDAALFGIDKTETEHRSGWWETSVGAEFGATKLRELKATIARFFKPA